MNGSTSPRRRRARRFAAFAVLAAFLAGPAQAATPSSAPPTAPAVKPVAPASPPQPAPPPTTAQRLEEEQQQLSQLQNQAQTVSNDAQLAAMGARAAAIEADADAVISTDNTSLAGVDTQLARVLPRDHRRPSAAQKQKSAPLLARQSALQAELTQAKDVDASAVTAYSQIAERRREGFSGRVMEQTATPLSPDFWTSLAGEAGGDWGRLAVLIQHAAITAEQAVEPQGLWALAAGVALALILLLPLRWLLAFLGKRLHRPKDGRGGVVLSALAIWTASVDTAIPTLASQSIRLSAKWGGLLSHRADDLAAAAVAAIAWGAAVLALGRVLAADFDAERRLVRLPEFAVVRLRFALWAVAVITALGSFFTRMNFVVGASVAATIAANCFVSLAYAAVAALVLVGFGRSRAKIAVQAPGSRANAPALTLVALATGAAIVVTVGAVLAGYTTLAALISSQIFWLSLLCAAAYLLLRFIDDLFNALFRERGWASAALAAVFGLRQTTIRQTGVLISAVLQLMILLGAFSLALTPFGESGDLLIANLGRLGHPFQIGSASISPMALATGLASLVIGVGVVHLIRGWLVRRYLPVTDWDAGVRNSVSTGVSYIGVGVALLCALGAMGLGFQQIALIASALSVGIGFGLQQVVQNFIAGVILLIERPVQVGDWIKTGDVEGDIRRIRVRATEIETLDQSRVIVPNSNLITNEVYDKTLGGSRIALAVSIADAADAKKAAELICDLARQQKGVLNEPPPAVLIDSLAAAGAVNFNCYIYVTSPREVLQIRSDLYFAILGAFAENKIRLLGG